MTITLVGSGAQASGPAGTTSLDVAYPAGIQADDLLVIQHHWNTITASDTPAGWTSQYSQNGGNSPTMNVLTKVADGTESGTLNIHQGGGAGNAIMHAFRGVDPVTPTDVAASSIGYGAPVSAKDIPSLTTSVAGVCLVVGSVSNVISGGETPPTSPDTFTEIYDSATNPRSSASYLVWSSSGATGTVTVTNSDASRGPAGMIALRPLGGPTSYEAVGSVEVVSDTSGSFTRNLTMSGTVVATSDVNGIIDGTATGASEGSKRDMLLALLIEQGYTTGTVSDRLYQREKETYEAGPKTYFEGNGPFSLSDYMLANGTDLRIIQ